MAETCRLQYIDALKGVAMLMVIVGHVLGFCGLGFNNEQLNIITLINMPLFFFLNGLVVNILPPPIISHDGCGLYASLARYLAKKCWQLMVPFFAWGAIKVLAFEPHTYLGFILNYWKYGYWYLVVLMEFYVTRVAIDCLQVRFPRLRSLVADIVLFVVTFMLLRRLSPLGGTTLDVALDVWQYLDLLPYFYIGTLVRRYDLAEPLRRATPRLLPVALAVAAALGVLSVTHWSSYYDMAWPATILLRTAIIAIFYLTFVAIGDYRGSIVGRQLLLVGRHTLVIYMAHYFLLGYINFGDTLTALHASGNILALLAIAIATAWILARVCIALGYILNLSPFTASILLGKLPHVTLEKKVK